MVVRAGRYPLAPAASIPAPPRCFPSVMPGPVPLLSRLADGRGRLGVGRVSPLPLGGRGRGRVSRRARTVAGFRPPPRWRRRTLRMAALAPPAWRPAPSPILSPQAGRGDLQPVLLRMRDAGRRSESRSDGTLRNPVESKPCTLSTKSEPDSNGLVPGIHAAVRRDAVEGDARNGSGHDGKSAGASLQRRSGRTRPRIPGTSPGTVRGDDKSSAVRGRRKCVHAAAPARLGASR